MKPIQARRAGEQVAELLKKDKAKLESRLPAGLLEGVKEDVRLLSNTMSNAIVARVQKKAATQPQNDTAEDLAGRVMAVRMAVKITGQSTVLRKALGVGRVVSAKSVKSVKSVLAAANMVIEAYAKYAEEMRAAGLQFGSTDPERAAQYAALIPARPKKRKLKPAPAPTPGL